MAVTSTKPYLLRAIYEWCTDNGFTPYIAVAVDHRTAVPMEYVKDGQIVLNISFTTTKGLKMENDYITLSARFSGVARDLVIPVDNVLAIYARENGQGMAFEVTRPEEGATETPQLPTSDSDSGSDRQKSGAEPTLSAVPGSEPRERDDDEPQPPRGPRPTLTRIK